MPHLNKSELCPWACHHYPSQHRTHLAACSRTDQMPACSCYCFRRYQESFPSLLLPALSSSYAVRMLGGLYFQVNFLHSNFLQQKAVPAQCQVKSYCHWVFLTEVLRLNCWSVSTTASVGASLRLRSDSCCRSPWRQAQAVEEMI